ncbi:MAG: hypothetical protein JWO30_1153 [Fibrobacteres bacterium]|nr:hypothetical protein [Fibrobacterota bacterium]
MRYSIPISILACSVSFAMASTPPGAKPNAAGEPVLRGNETAVPMREKAPAHKKTEKSPTPREKSAEPEKQAPADSPAEAEDMSDCDDCVIVRAVPAAPGYQEVVTPSVAVAGAVTASTGSRPGGWPMALARTLWGLFFVGRPRAIPRTRIRGITVR